MADPVMIDAIYQGEGKWLPFTILDADGNPKNIASATFTLHVRNATDLSTLVYSAVDWDDSEAANGIIKANLPASQTALMAPGTYLAQLKTVMEADKDVDISPKVMFFVLEAIVT